MKETIKTFTGKRLDLPTRMFTFNDLKNMGIEYVENKVLFNRTPHYKKFAQIPEEIAKHMVVVNYPDFSNKEFNDVNSFIVSLKEKISEQKISGSDIIVLSSCKNETDQMVRAKFDLVNQLKEKEDLQIMVEISYKSSMDGTELATLSGNADFLAIFYGAPYGHYPSLKRLLVRLAYFKAHTSKKVFSMGVPMKFSGDTPKEVHFMPCFDIVSDGWSKCWRRGGGPQKIKVVDPEDFLAKNYTSWLESGYSWNTMLPSINCTVTELFEEKNKHLREEFERYVLDEAISEIGRLNPLTLEGYIGRKFDGKYFQLILAAYREKIIIKYFRENPLFSHYVKEDLLRLESRIRKNHYMPYTIIGVIRRIGALVQQNHETPVAELIKVVDKIDFDL